MAHHGDDLRATRSFFETASDRMAKPGATGRYPLGKLTDDDEGEIAIGIAADPSQQKIVIDFGKPVAWIGFTPEQAAEIGETLLKKSRECRGISD